MKVDLDLQILTHQKSLEGRGFDATFVAGCTDNMKTAAAIVASAKRRIKNEEARLKPEVFPQARADIAREAYRDLKKWDKSFDAMRTRQTQYRQLFTADITTKQPLEKILDFLELQEIRQSLRGMDPLLIVQRYDAGNERLDRAIEHSPVPLLPQHLIDATRMRRARRDRPDVAEELAIIDECLALNDSFFKMAVTELKDAGGVDMLEPDTVATAAKTGKGLQVI